MNDYKTYRLIPIVITILTTALFWHSSKTITSVIIFIPGAIISYLFCLKYIRAHSSTSDRFLPWYLFALAIQLIHFLEEYLTGFIHKLPALIEQKPYPLDDWITFNMIAYSVFILGGIAIYKKRNAYMIIPVFFILIGVLFNGIAHVLLSMYSGGYFPGLITAIVYLFLGPFLVKMLIEDNRNKINH